MATRAPWWAQAIFLDLNVDGASERLECRLDLLKPRCVVEAEQAIDALPVFPPQAAHQLSSGDAGRSQLEVEQDLEHGHHRQFDGWAAPLPRLEILPRIVRSPVDSCLGTSPSREGASLLEAGAVADRRHHRTRDDRTDARHGHQELAAIIVLRQRLEAVPLCTARQQRCFLDDRFHETSPLQLVPLARKTLLFRRPDMIRILEAPD
jgi:hypothetical protein